MPDNVVSGRRKAMKLQVSLLMDTILAKRLRHNFRVKAYVDDMVGGSSTLEEHLADLDDLPSLLNQYNIALEPTKAYIGFPDIELLRQKVDALGISIPVEKIKAIASLKFPQTLNALEVYLGTTGALRQYVRGYTAIVEPLQQRKTELLKKSPKKGQPRKQWSLRTMLRDPTAKELASFEAIQDHFRNPRWLSHWDAGRRLYVDLDSSKENGHGVMAFHLT